MTDVFVETMVFNVLFAILPLYVKCLFVFSLLHNLVNLPLCICMHLVNVCLLTNILKIMFLIMNLIYLS